MDKMPSNQPEKDSFDSNKPAVFKASDRNQRRDCIEFGMQLFSSLQKTKSDLQSIVYGVAELCV